MNCWLVKEEPSSYSFDQFLRDGRTVWSGVKNPLAQQHLRAMRKGDRVMYYHTGNEKAVVGLAKAAGNAYPDPADPAGKRHAVELVPDKKLKNPVSLATIKADKAFANFPMVRISRLSVMPVSAAEWKRILELSGP